MNQTIVRLVTIGFTAGLLAACNAAPVGPAGVPSSTNVNPITQSRGGTAGGGADSSSTGASAGGGAAGTGGGGGAGAAGGAAR